MEKFQKYVLGRVDGEVQEKKNLSETETLICKPHTEGGKKFNKRWIRKIYKFRYRRSKENNDEYKNNYSGRTHKEIFNRT